MSSSDDSVNVTFFAFHVGQYKQKDWNRFAGLLDTKCYHMMSRVNLKSGNEGVGELIFPPTSTICAQF